jgi:pyruvate formate lyase activating enzyme
MNNDPIEKKPLFHFFPGSRSLSIAAAGCNLRCDHCQNWSISQWPRDKTGWSILPGEDALPGDVAKAAKKAGSKSISYTYTEPTIYLEYALDVMKEARPLGLLNVFVTNGFMTPETIGLLTPFLDAANVDLKSSSDDFYKDVCGGRVEPVKEAISLLWKSGVWIEVTTLVIPDRNDSDEDLAGVAEFLAGLSRDIPWHISAFHPDYKLSDVQATPPGSIYKAIAIGKKAGLRFVYAGNMPGEDGENTFCPSCGKPVLERYGFRVSASAIRGGACMACGAILPGRW